MFIRILQGGSSSQAVLGTGACGVKAACEVFGRKVVNPLRYPKEGEECELFRSTDKVRMAWGVTHLLDNVPYKEGSLLRNMIINHLGRSQYYLASARNALLRHKTNRPFACCSAREASAKSRHSTTTQMNLTGNIRHTVTAACNTLYDNSLPL